MLTKVTAYSQWANVPPLVLNVINRPETDLFEVRDFGGLGDVKADVNTTPKGSIAGATFIGSNTDIRNLVLTLGLNPDWDTWTISRLRRLLAKYFTPEQSIRFVFETMEFSPVEISGYIESNEPNIFSKDPEHQISIICPDLYFKTVDPVIISGDSAGDPIDIDYQGNIETGMHVLMSKVSGEDPELVQIQVEDPDPTFIIVNPDWVYALDATHNLIVNTLPGDKYVHKVTIADGTIENFLSSITYNSTWPKIGPGTDTFAVTTNLGIIDWELTYYELFGSL